MKLKPYIKLCRSAKGRYGHRQDMQQQRVSGQKIYRPPTIKGSRELVLAKSVGEVKRALRDENMLSRVLRVQVAGDSSPYPVAGAGNRLVEVIHTGHGINGSLVRMALRRFPNMVSDPIALMLLERERRRNRV